METTNINFRDVVWVFELKFAWEKNIIIGASHGICKSMSWNIETFRQRVKIIGLKVKILRQN